jgi:hypothetical protein
LDVAPLGGGGVHQHGIGIAAAGHLERGAGADRDNLDLDARPVEKDRHDGVQQPAVLGAGGGGEDEISGLLGRDRQWRVRPQHDRRERGS